MGSFQRNKSNHWIDIKGKGILYDEDDEPIKLTDQDTSQNIIEFQLHNIIFRRNTFHFFRRLKSVFTMCMQRYIEREKTN
uniref:Uncharacterized protein n=1 Tax=Brassica oleracea TaxID=3712 RepID=A0A3P6DJQ6_BRAOL|nr:unnamed protein product [Brassica oleracea]